MKPIVAAFAALSAALVIGMIVTSVSSPLFPFQTGSKQWLQDWLAFTVADYYGVAIPLSAIMIATEGRTGFAWAAGTLLLGSPVACAYVAWRLAKGSIALQGAAPQYGYF